VAEPDQLALHPPVTAPNGHVELATVYPATGPQEAATIQLVNHLRDDLIPQAADSTGLVVHVGGVTASNIDFAAVLTSKLPLFIAVVVILAFVLLLVVFRSLLVPLIASVLNLLSVGAGLGALNAVFHWGWGTSLFGLSGSGPIDSFVPGLPGRRMAADVCPDSVFPWASRRCMTQVGHNPSSDENVGML